jgi:flavin reductase (DIM6/NTAB) family NADH-FMN oxidoreductase RutF
MNFPLPQALKRALQPTRQWLAVSLAPERQAVRVRLVAPGASLDVTANVGVAALRPFMLRMSLVTADVRGALKASPSPRLEMMDSEIGRVIGAMDLAHEETWTADGVPIGLFSIRYAAHRCVSWPRRTWDTLMYQRAARNVPSDRQLMEPAAVEQMLVFYLRPRPVFLVSVDDGQHSNIFPMDLVGPLPPDRFTLALRNTSPSVETIKRARRVAMAELPGTACRVAYKLGVHHKSDQVDWNGLPFKTRRSQHFGLHVPDIAVGVREVEILDFRSVGSHTLFVGRICSSSLAAEAASNGADNSTPRLFHTCGANQRLRTRYKRPFDEALA